MALPKYDRARHHIGLGPEDQPEPYGFLLSGAYAQTGQQYGAPTEFGGDRDLIATPTLSRWSCDDFSGGQFSYRWSTKGNRFAGGLHLIPGLIENTLRTVPPLLPYKLFNNGSRAPKYVFAWGGDVFAVFTNLVKRFGLGGTTPFEYLKLGSGADYISAAALDRGEGELYYFDNSTGNTTSNFLVRRLLPTLTSPPPIGGSVQISAYPPPSNGGRPITALTLQDGDVIAECGASVWRLHIPDDKTLVVNAGSWTRLGRLPGRWVDSLYYNKQLHILCQNADTGASLVVYDTVSNSILPVCDLPFNFNAKALASYGGRLYISGVGQEVNGGDSYGELYEITGASVRVVGSFAGEAAASNVPARPKGFYSVGVHDGLLYVGDTGRALMAYDVTRDGFFPGPGFSPPDGVREVREMVSYRRTLYAYVRHPLDPNQDGLYRVARNGDEAAIPGDHKALYYTSDFGPEPDRRKRWAEFRVLTRFGSATLEYSIDGGRSYHGLLATETVEGDFRITTAALNGVPTSKQIRFRVSLPRDPSRPATGYTELVGHTLAFAMLDSGKWTWQVTINGTGRVERPEGVGTEIQNVRDIGLELRRYYRDKIPLRFLDVDGQEYLVQVYSYAQSQPVIAPEFEVHSPELGWEAGREAFHQLTLLEV